MGCLVRVSPSPHARSAKPRSRPPIPNHHPSYLNFQNPVDVIIGNERLQEFAQRVKDSNADNTPWDLLTDCLAAPELGQEMVFPDDL